MANPIVHNFPVRRPNFIEDAFWIGDDDDLALNLKFTDVGGVQKSIQLETQNAERKGELCRPNSNDILDMADTQGRVRDILAAHVRMAVLVKGHAVPGSQEFADALVDDLLGSNNFQTSIGTVKVTDVTLIDHQCVDLEFKQGSGPKRTFTFDYQELMNYTFVPVTQLLVVSGAVEKEFPSYVHDHPNDVLSSSQKQDVVDYVMSLAPWV